MNLKQLLIILPVFLISCYSNRLVSTSKDKDKVETLEYRNFKNERVQDYSEISIVRKFYKDNKLVSLKYFDINDEPVKNKNSSDKQNAEWRFEYDKNGNFVRQTAHGLNGELFDVEHWANSAIEIFEYNDKNQLIKRSNYDKSMKMVGLGDMGDAMSAYGYNDKGQLIWKRSFNANEKPIKNGFCYSKYEYNENGSLKTMYYLYDEDKINMTFRYTYKNGQLEKEETFDETGNKIGYEIYTYKEDRIIAIEDWYHKWDKPSLKKEQISLEVEGWQIKDADLNSLNLGKPGKGEYDITINDKGRITNITPIKYKAGRPAFNNEVYNKFQDIVLEKKDNTSSTLNGKLVVSILHQNSLFSSINRALKPKPFE